MKPTNVLSCGVIFALCIVSCIANMGTPEILQCQRPVVSKTPNMVMQVSDCNDPKLCHLIRNTTHTVTFTFTSTESTSNLKMQVFGQVMRVRVPYVRNVDLCKDTVSTDGEACNGKGLTAGKTYVSTYNFHIRSRFPEWLVPVEFELWDGSRKLSCSQIKVKIQCNAQTERNCGKPKSR